MQSWKFAARLHVDAVLTEGGGVALDSDQTHYLRSVLRLGEGTTVALFNGRDGEWLGRIAGYAKHSARVELAAQTRLPTPERPVWLLFAPVKRARIDFIAEKATELGATVLQPVFTERTIVARVNQDRLAANAREAAEQSERLSLPEIRPPRSLFDAVAALPPEIRLILCDETGTAPPISQVLSDEKGVFSSGCALLTGPEGGFTETELDRLRKLPFVTPVSLGPRVLRADTAVLAALAVFQAIAGDWTVAGGDAAVAAPPPFPSPGRG
ncbi:MAG TPA: 16S rRNA (uracil(1498)-N(3))-methyltransferase [Stellaceae bacterium]|nr:16S rRNA (uracil(1498)-N(3))-methyltransferase [Stellaceae bacterium]